MARKKTKRKASRKDPKRVAAGRKGAAARYGKPKKSSKKRKETISKLDRAIEKVLARRYAISIDGAVHKVTFPGGHAKKAGKRKRKVSAETLEHLARGRAIRKANLAAQFGPIYDPKLAGKGGLYAQRLANLAKARAAKAAKSAQRAGQAFIGGFI